LALPKNHKPAANRINESADGLDGIPIALVFLHLEVGAVRTLRMIMGIRLPEVGSLKSTDLTRKHASTWLAGEAACNETLYAGAMLAPMWASWLMCRTVPTIGWRDLASMVSLLGESSFVSFYAY
jgi:hypothetical protein